VIVRLILTYIVLVGLTTVSLSQSKDDGSGPTRIGRTPKTYPDYDKAVIPANIAPLNMVVDEKADVFTVRIKGQQGEAIELSSRSGKINIPIGQWRKLIKVNRGMRISIDVLAGSNGKWSLFEPLELTVADAEIDRYLVYRAMHPTHQHVASPIRITCRDLTTFRDWTILDGARLDNACINCHSFPANRPDQMLVGIRSSHFGIATLATRPDGHVEKIAAKFGYTSWHPSGDMAAYSINNLPMFYHAARPEPRDTVDLDSMIACYRPKSGQISLVPPLTDKQQLETWPTWSADGKYLYYCTTSKPWPERTEIPPAGYDQVRYDLMRIHFDPNTGAWGQGELVLSAKTVGGSIAMPRCSLDGRWISFCRCSYGFFPTWQHDSDIYLLDLTNGSYRIAIAEPKAQSWPCWSSNSRFLAFSSKSQDDQFTRIMICYVDPNGNLGRPFVVPQEDPLVYRSTLWAYNTPELLKDKPAISANRLYRAAMARPSVKPNLPVTSATPKAATFRPPGARD